MNRQHDQQMNTLVDAADARMALSSQTKTTLQLLVDELTSWTQKPPKDVKSAAAQLLTKIEDTCQGYGITTSEATLPKRP